MDLIDVARHQPEWGGVLAQVGMDKIALPVVLEGQSIVANVDIGVSLDDAEQRGIHMSRLYQSIQAVAGMELTPEVLKQVLSQCLQAHETISSKASIRISGEIPLERSALISDFKGWKTYPFELSAQLDEQGYHLALGCHIGYSSTCPCSAALARQLIQARFEKDFDQDEGLSFEQVHQWLGATSGIVATPHSQRSDAHVQLQLDPEIEQWPLLTLIDRVEATLGTALQTAVKRVDEQAFALANGQNLMFCEDAARRLSALLKPWPQALTFALKVIHAESLHAHDAVAAHHGVCEALDR
ncbi:GTP cyclohydrolase [Terasakiispira papahanaumokuakeensis]|uniref:GTP cyclohydrolase n=1 Tax=Terasakiispira papahanaumokuakeensis TaxID=197479 RepID=A0A1E2VCR1_9GAMM|nr:GTP cyclohydrolase FolE2 [Terasakiispira papahanaumokuakeensis]ODC04777.1 GTP cyclohydrolase [Terasakiispira papahanaumokuakeensis]